LTYSTNSDALKELFQEAGEVETVTIIMDKITGQSKGFGFVEMVTEDDAQKAIEMFNGKEFDGRNIIVNEARPQEDRPRGRGFNRNGGGRRDDRRNSRY
jgi:RNA recognition motif-containing protein